MCDSPYMEIGGYIHPAERKYGSESLRHLIYSQINTSGTVPKIKQKQVKVKRGSKSSEHQERVKSSKISLSDKIPIKQVREISVWYTKY